MKEVKHDMKFLSLLRYDFPPFVIPAKAGIQSAPEHPHVGLDSRFRGNDRIKE